MPKSASSSLAGHFIERHGMAEMTQSFRDRATQYYSGAQAYKHIGLHNEGLVEITQDVIRLLSETPGVIKYHFPPPPGNQALLRDMKKVILLREPEDVVRAWMRGDETRAYKLRSPEFVWCYSEASWMAKARDLGLLDELAAFGDGWRAHQGDCLVIEMRDLTARPGETLAKVESYLGLPATNARALPERKFSRGEAATRGRINMRLRQVIRRRNVMVRRLFGDLRNLIGGVR
jgi:hypothetical protein